MSQNSMPMSADRMSNQGMPNAGFLSLAGLMAAAGRNMGQGHPFMGGPQGGIPSSAADGPMSSLGGVGGSGIVAGMSNNGGGAGGGMVNSVLSSSPNGAGGMGQQQQQQQQQQQEASPSMSQGTPGGGGGGASTTPLQQQPPPPPRPPPFPGLLNNSDWNWSDFPTTQEGANSLLERGRSRNWTYEETLELIGAYTSEEWQGKFGSEKKNHRAIWSALAAALTKRKDVSGDEARQRLNNLKALYNRTRRQLLAGEISSPQWEYWDPLHAFLGRPQPFLPLPPASPLPQFPTQPFQHFQGNPQSHHGMNRGPDGNPHAQFHPMAPHGPAAPHHNPHALLGALGLAAPFPGFHGNGNPFQKTDRNLSLSGDGKESEGGPPSRGEDRKYDFGSLSSSSGGGAPFAPGLNENSTESGEGAAGGGGGGGGGGGACEEGPVPMSPEQFLCEDMEHAGGASPHTPSSSSHQRPESYKLRHNNHLTLVLESLAGDESFMDVTLTAQGKAIKAHKSVLSAVSPYFRSVLKENPCQHPIIIMPRDIRFEELNNIISYVYKGEMTVAAEDLSSMLKTAEVLQVTGLSPSEAGSGAGGIMSHMQGLPAGVFGAGAAPPAKAKKAKHVHTQQHQVVAHEEEPHAANNHDIRGRIDPLDFLNADMTCVKEEIPSDTEETEDMGFTLPDDSSGPASKVTEPLPAAASFSSDPSTTRHPSNRRKSLDSPRPMDDPSNKPFNPGEPGPSPTEPQAAAAATPSPSSTPPPPHVCPHCLETHRPTDALHSHLRLKHPSKPSFVCASCGKVFLRHSLFAEHSKKCKV